MRCSMLDLNRSHARTILHQEMRGVVWCSPLCRDTSKMSYALTVVEMEMMGI